MKLRLPIVTSLIIATLFVLGGCSLVGERTPVTLYDLPAKPLSPSSGTATDITLRLATPGASGLLVSPRILVVPQPNQPQVYSGVRWVNNVPQLLRDRIADAFLEDGRMPRLIHAESMVSADIELISNLRAFHSEYVNGTPEAVIVLDARLVDARSQHLIDGKRFTHRHPASSEAIPDVVEAFGVASDSLMRDLVDWTLQQQASY